ncbi:E3 ubiquitin-protein ligase DCST1 [Callorhinchus milii]|uniref:E3 ubiquitin-protein ligase DCST1 n=1 Tax=Callorhinchus milii TaxID=7868 RepID=UPI001C3FD23F|nr:E3 ubiquitin-protein ligase DCST1 [Callorhinchus milii]
MGETASKGEINSEKTDTEQRKKRKQRGKPANTTLKMIVSHMCPSLVTTFLWSKPEEFRVTKFFMGFGLGAMLAVGFYFVLVDKLDLFEEHKFYILCAMVCVMGLGWAVSVSYRCAILMILPNMLGSEGRTFVLMLLVTIVMHGPVANIEKNVEIVGNSVACTVELQINHTKKLWKIMQEPLKKVLKDMKKNSDMFGKETDDVQKKFHAVNDQIISKEGFKENSGSVGNGRHLSTQSLFELKTKMRCDFIVDLGIQRCRKWFDIKYVACMRKLVIPLFNHLFCLPMTFKFLCNIVKLMTPWCRDRIPVDGNFGQLYDKVNSSVSNLNNNFKAEMAITSMVQQESIVGANFSKAQVTETLRKELIKKKDLLNSIVDIITLILSCTFAILFISAFLYTRNYNNDIRFDNVYISKYFRQIDSRRKAMNRKHLLPFKKAERPNVIFPWQRKVHSAEMRSLVLGLLQCVPQIILVIVLFVLDWLLYTMLDIIQRHSYIEYNFGESHHLEITVEGTSLLANLIRKAVSAFNTTLDIQMESNNLRCLPVPEKMLNFTIAATIIPLIAVILFCFLQIYVFRTRRVIAAFYFPKREKQRVLFLYNEFLRKRMAYAEIQRKRVIIRARRRELWKLRGLAGFLHRHLPWLRGCLRRHCLVCQESETPASYHCPTPQCGAIYCPSCWDDLRRYCFACMPFQEFISESSDNENDAVYRS